MPTPAEESLAKVAYRLGWGGEISQQADAGGAGVLGILLVVIIHGGMAAIAVGIALLGIGPGAALLVGAIFLSLLAVGWLGRRWLWPPVPPAPPDDWPWAQWQPATERRHRAWKAGRRTASALFLLEFAIVAVVGVWAEMSQGAP